MHKINPNIIFNKLALRRYFGVHDIIFLFFLVLSLSFCGGSPGIIKPETRYQAPLKEGFAFAKDGNPTFIKRISGLAGRESWGRWSDQNEVSIEFVEDLLPGNYIFEILAQGFGPNINSEALIVVGNVSLPIRLESVPKKFIIPIGLTVATKIIKIFPPKPTSPHDLDFKNLDKRQLGVGLIYLSVN